MAQYTSQLWLVLGALILAVGLPFVAVLILDGVVALFRRAGPSALAGAVAATVVVGGLGWALLAVGVEQLTGSSSGAAYTSDALSLMRSVLVVTVPLALLSFAVRVIWMIGHRRTRHGIPRY